MVGLLWERCTEAGALVGIAYSFIFNILPLVTGFAYPSALPGYFVTSAIAVALTVVVSLVTPKPKLSESIKAVMEL